MMKDGLLPDPLLLWAIHKIPTPQNIKELQTFFESSKVLSKIC